MCGIFGYVNYGNCLNEKQLTDIYASFSKACITRGSHACGIAYVSDEVLNVKKEGLDLVSAGFVYPKNVEVLMAHCRLSLQNDYLDNDNNHPFRGKTLDGTAYVFGHNGILMDLREIRQKLSLEKPNIGTDSYLIAQVLDTKHRLNCQTLKEVCETLHGSFSFTILDEKNNLYICRGDVPIYLVHYKKLKLYLYISTRDLFEKAIASTDLWYSYKTTNLEASTSSVNIIPLRKGSILKISPVGELTREEFSFRDDKSISHNWYLHEITIAEELKEQLANLNNL